MRDGCFSEASYSAATVLSPENYLTVTSSITTVVGSVVSLRRSDRDCDTCAQRDAVVVRLRRLLPARPTCVFSAAGDFAWLSG